jgi:hypothetical protein
MASGFFLGGLGQGINDTADVISKQTQQNYLNETKAKQQAVDNQRTMTAQGQKLINDAISHLGELKSSAAPGTSIANAAAPFLRTIAGIAQKIYSPQEAELVVQRAQSVASQPAAPAEGNWKTTVAMASDGSPIAVMTDAKTGAHRIVPIGSNGAPATDNMTVSGSTISQANPNGIPQPVSSPGASVAPSGVDTTPPPISTTNDTISAGFDALKGAGPQAFEPAPTKPKYAPGSVSYEQAIQNGVTGEDFLTAAVPAKYQNIVRDIANYKIDPKSNTSLRQLKGQGESERSKVINYVSQYSNHTYDQKYYPMMQQAVKEFNTGGSQSPATKITAGNTAIQHLGTISEGVRDLQDFPGFLAAAAKSGTPFLSYVASNLRNSAVKGTPLGSVLQKIISARSKFAGEVTQYYAGTQGSEADRARTISELDTALSIPELSASISTDAELFQSKVNALQDRYKTAMAGPNFNDAVIRNAIPDFPIIQQKSREALMTIKSLSLQANPQTRAPIGTAESGSPTAAPKVIIQNGYRYDANTREPLGPVQ